MAAQASEGFPWGFTAVLVVSALLYLLSVSALSGSRASDAAGNGMAVAFGAVLTILMWIGIAVLLLMARSHGGIPGWSKAFLVVLVPLAAIAGAVTIGIYSERGGWLFWVPIAAPLLTLIYAAWARYPGLQSMMAVEGPNAVVIAVLAFATVAPFVAVSL
jgi:hypothetical protein